MNDKERLDEILVSKEENIFLLMAAYYETKNIIFDRLGIEENKLAIQKTYLQNYRKFYISDNEMLNFYINLEAAFFHLESYIKSINRFSSVIISEEDASAYAYLVKMLEMLNTERNACLEVFGYLNYHNLDQPY